MRHRLNIRAGAAALLAVLYLSTLACAQTTQSTGQRRPAKLYWGGYTHMDQLVQPDAQWDFVRSHMDAFFLHGAYWLHDKSAIEVARKLAPQLKAAGKTCVLEVGWPQHTVDDFDNMGRNYAVDHAAGIARLQAAGLVINDVSIDWHLFLFSMVARKHPDWTSRDVLAQITGDRAGYTGPAYAGYWADYVRVLHARCPTIRLYLCSSPVYISWGDMPCYGPQVMSPHPVLDDNKKPLLFNGKPVNLDIDGSEWFASMFRMGSPNGVVGFITDSPYNYTWEWPDVKARQNHFAKILGYEHWLHDRSLLHVLVCNDSGKHYQNLNEADWDALYERNSLLALQNYQIAGGRADAYQLESWYSGPYTIVPESQPGSFAHLAAAAIRYLQGPGEHLTLTVTDGGVNRPKSPDQVVHATSVAGAPVKFHLRLTNTGDVDCLPALSVPSPMKLLYRDQDISNLANTAEGWTAPALVHPGDSIDLIADVAPSDDANGDHLVEVKGYWNPQDPSGIARDTLTLSVRRN